VSVANFMQEDVPHQIGQAIADWLTSIDVEGAAQGNDEIRGKRGCTSDATD
jgi:hypothetical protein